LTNVTLHEGDSLEVIPRLVARGVVVDAVVTDPLNGKGFMSMAWDGTGIAFRPETWAIIATLLRPGGFLLAFGGTRTSHRMVCAIEDAGFVIQDTIMWLYGSGFPERKDMLKPAFEPICLAYKPAGKRLLAVDECRIPATQRDARGNHSPRPTNAAATSYDLGSGYAIGKTDVGRWPANIIHDGSDEVLEAFPESLGQQGDVRGTEPSQRLGKNGIYGLAGSKRPAHPRRDTENGATNFGALPEMRREATSAARFFYCAKAGKQDRWGSKHPTVKPVELTAISSSWYVRLEEHSLIRSLEVERLRSRRWQKAEMPS
jgi:hypothetical protein